ncbi:MAG: peptidoglycan DD-metalloendopeptidase family protein [Deltaproteobacteria bacterium]|nr:peptidoglycan DD-metalloendopeptidase family protein [Deltaproteobacteria bacterium]MBW2658339.1 peptidoglycan DD-metalloendopeptidase family protein [Deltaproteobacteria bacterium]
MNEHLHVIITGDTGKIVRFPTSRKKLRLFFTGAVLTLLFLAITTFFSISLFTENHSVSNRLTVLEQQLKMNENSLNRQKETSNETIAELRSQLMTYEEKKEKMSTAASELNERNEVIEKVMDTLGIDLNRPKESGTKNSGGPFIKEPKARYDDLLYTTDKYLKTIQHIPLGRPIKGSITSRFGKRKDPVNRKNAFHSGIDLHGTRGEKIRATADGIVEKVFRNGGYGKYISINHGNGYTTGFAHLKKYLVKKGESVKRGQVIGLVGNTGRSTGPHLHYEICLDKKPINPYKFMKIASLVKSGTASPEKK